MALGTGARLAAGAGVAAVVVAVVVAIFGGTKAPAPDPVQTPAAESAASAPQDPAPAPEAPASLPPEAPRFDVVRVDAAGLASVAGSAAPDSTVSLRVDGVEAAEARADGQGKFATLFTLPPSDLPRLLSLVAILPDGTEVPGVETVALAPIAAPVEVAAAAGPVAEPAAEPVAEPGPAEGAADAPAPADQALSEPPSPEAPPPAALLMSPEGVEVLQTGAPADPAAPALSIDSIAYAPDGAVMVGGRGAAGAVVRLYLDDAALADAAVEAGGAWSVTLPEVAPGLHSLRADQIDGTGKVTARVETPFKREDPAALAAALAPAGPAPVAAEPAPAAPAAPAPEAPAAPAAPAKPAPVAAAPAVPVPQAEAAPAVAPAPVTVVVQPGFTLWAIAEANFGEGVMYVQVFEANRDKIRDPDLIYPGQVFTVPKP